MKEKNTQSNTEFSADELNLMTLAKQYSDEDKARALFEKLRWPNGPVCPHCKNDGKAKSIYELKPKPGSKSPARAGVYKCGACRQQFTAKVGTVLEASHIPIATWLMALFIMCSSKKSVSSLQLSRMLDVTYKTAWFITHRIRYGVQPENSNLPKLKGTVEIDETFVGGKTARVFAKASKTPVVALIERGGDMRTKVVSSVTIKNLKTVISENVDTKAIVNTDDASAYRNQLKAFAGHDVVVHSKKEYALKTPEGRIAHVNNCESFFSLLKRGVVGSWHSVSREHLPKYAGEFSFRWNHRHITDGERLGKACLAIEGKRLTYRQAV